MNASKVVFYSVSLLVVIAIAWVSMSIFSPSSTDKIANQVRSTFSSNQKSSTDRRAQNQSNQKSSIWTDARFRNDAAIKEGSFLPPMPDEVKTKIADAQLLFGEGKDSEYLARLDQLIQANPDVPHYRALKGDYYLGTFDLEKALPLIEDLSRSLPDNQNITAILAETQAKMGKVDEAAAGIKKILDQNPTHLQALYTHLSITELQGKPQEGIDFVKNVYQQNPSDPRASLIYSDVLLGEAFLKGNNEEAAKQRLEVIQKGVSANPTFGPLLRLAAEEALFSNDLKKAIELSQRAAQNETQFIARKEAAQLWIEAAERQKDERSIAEAKAFMSELNR